MTPSTAPRSRAVERLRGLLQRRGSPRVQMFFLLLLTGLAGFLCSVVLHAAGMRAMALRYPVAVGFAYLTFFFLLYLWLASYRRRRHPAGGTGSVFWDPWPYPCDPGPVSAAPPPPGGQPAASGGGGGGGWDLGDGAALVVVVLIVVAVVVALVASIAVLVEAPVLLAEVLVDGVLTAGLARRVSTTPCPHWTAGVVRRTWLPALAVAVVFGLVGYGLQCAAPRATTMGEALHAVQPR